MLQRPTVVSPKTLQQSAERETRASVQRGQRGKGMEQELTLRVLKPKLASLPAKTAEVPGHHPWLLAPRNTVPETPERPWCAKGNL